MFLIYFHLAKCSTSLQLSDVQSCVPLGPGAAGTPGAAGGIGAGAGASAGAGAGAGAGLS